MKKERSNKRKIDDDKSCLQKSGGVTMSSSSVSHSPPNPLLNAQKKFLSSLPIAIKEHFFCVDKVVPEIRAEIWAKQAEIGEELVNKYSWATPDSRAIRILSHYQPIVEVGSGSNAYWARMMNQHGIDITAYDCHIEEGGKIHHEGTATQGTTDITTKTFEDGFVLKLGTPAVLSEPDMSNKTLFLCYPDEDVMEEEDELTAESMGAACLEHFKGDYVIHVGELFGDCLSIDQAPWGRSSGPQFQERLATEYHCILKVRLNNWLHVRDSLSVWKRTKTCSIVFTGEGEDESTEEVEYRHIPMYERLPVDLAAPCVPSHLMEED